MNVAAGYVYAQFSVALFLPNPAEVLRRLPEKTVDAIMLLIGKCHMNVYASWLP